MQKYTAEFWVGEAQPANSHRDLEARTESFYNSDGEEVATILSRVRPLPVGISVGTVAQVHGTTPQQYVVVLGPHIFLGEDYEREEDDDPKWTQVEDLTDSEWFESTDDAFAAYDEWLRS